MVNIDRLQGVTEGIAIKAPVRCATTAAITLSGLQTIDSVGLDDGDRVLVKDQADARENGIYRATSGTWTRTKDCDGNRDLTEGSIVLVNHGTTNGGIFYSVTTPGDIVVSETALTWATFETSVEALDPLLEVPKAIAFLGEITAAITSDQNDYAPTDFSAATVVRLSSNGNRNITGLAGGGEGRTIYVYNVGSFNIVLKDESSASAAANRFGFGTDLTLASNRGATLIYDSTASRWRQIGGPGLAGTVTSVATSGLATGGPVTASGTVTVTAATQSDMVTGTSTSVAVVPAVQKHHPAHPKAWATVTQSGGSYTIVAAHGVHSIAKNSTGRITITWTPIFGNSNYAVAAMPIQTGPYVCFGTGSTTTSTFQLGIRNANTNTDADVGFTVVAFGEQ